MPTNLGEHHSQHIVEVDLNLEDYYLAALPKKLRDFIKFECELNVDSSDAYRLWRQGEPVEYLLEQLKKFSRMQHMATYPAMEAKKDAVYYSIYPQRQQSLLATRTYPGIDSYRF